MDEIKNPAWGKLNTCIDYDKIDSVLDETGMNKDIKYRATFLYGYMGIHQTFTCTTDGGDITSEEDYAFAKQQLVFMNERHIRFRIN